MRIIDCQQQSEEWERWRNRPTASEFGSFVTPAKGQYSAQATAYAAKIVAKRLGVYTEPPPTFWMEWGIEHEPNAKHAYTKLTGREIVDVGFILPDNTDAYGGSPDGLVGDDGIIEIKCPAPETLIAYHAAGELPIQYRPQVQALLLISGRAWCDFFVFHPELTPLLVRSWPDLEYQTKIAECLLLLLEEIKSIESCVKRQRHELVSVGTRKDNVRFDDEA
ncbi:MAG: lambda exonuclease family protein [Chloroflexota bacterium]